MTATTDGRNVLVMVYECDAYDITIIPTIHTVVFLCVDLIFTVLDSKRKKVKPIGTRGIYSDKNSVHV